MKKLIFLLLILSVFVSCKQNEDDSRRSIPRSEWDADNIAYTNTDDSYNKRYGRNNSIYYPDMNSAGVYQNNINGIIGKFTDSETSYTNYGVGSNNTEYEFFDTGYYSYKDSGYTSSSQTFSNEDSGTFVLSIPTDTRVTGYYKVVLTSEKGHGIKKFYYSVSQYALDLKPYVIINNESLYP